ncbi:MAG TPA: energy transducer TonB, partial [Croceibacterium sp.]
MRKLLGAIMAAAVLAVASPALAEDLTPEGPWAIDYDDDSCALRRGFGSGERRAVIELRRFGPDQPLQGVVTSWMRPRRNLEFYRGEMGFRYRFGEEDQWRRDSEPLSLRYDNGDFGVLFYPSFLNLREPDEFATDEERKAYYEALDRRTLEREQGMRVESITLQDAFTSPLTLPLGSLGQPMQALHACIDELMTHWNIDLEAHKTLSRKAAPINLPEVSSMISYPPKMAQRSMPGIVNVRLDIDETGRITACHIQMPLSDPAFEESSCPDIQHALDFDPALDKDGNPIPSYWITR